MNESSARIAGTLILVGAIIAIALPAVAQETTEPPQARFEGTVEVDVITLDVVVTDRRGRPITDLVASDFRILEDGREVELTNFLAIRETARGQLQALPEATEAASPEEAKPAEAATAAPPRHLVLYLDWAFLSSPSFKRMQADLQRFLREDVPPGTRVMLAACDRKVEVMVPFTEDLEAVAEALGREARRAALGRLTDLDELTIRRLWAPELSNPTGGGGGGVSPQQGVSAEQAQAWLEQSLNALADETRTRTRRSWRLLQSLVDSLAVLEGRKVLIYVSDGVPLRPDAWQSATGQASGGRTPRTPEHGTLDQALLEVIAHANTLGVTIHTVSGEGLAQPLAGNVISPEVSGSVAFGRTDQLREEGFNRKVNLTDTVQTVARATGGVAVLKASATNLKELAADVGTYYSLGYRPPRGADGRPHEVKVKVARRGAEVRHRASYIALDRRTKVAAKTYSALLMESTSNPLALELAVSAAGRPDGELFQVPFTIQVPSARLALTPDADLWTGQIRVFLTAFSEDGELAPMQEQVVPIRVALPPAEQEQPMLMVPGQLQLRPGLHMVAASLLDEVSGIASTTRAEIILDLEGGLWRPEWAQD